MTETLAQTASGVSLRGQDHSPDKIRFHRGETLEPRFSSQSGLLLELTTSGPMLPPVTSHRRLHLALKRAADIVVSAVALLCLLPVLIVVASAIKLTSPGPVLFVQSRPGLGGKPFHMLKFRTIHAEYTDLSGIAQTKRGDARVTPLGRLLRRKGIDELPQLLNILMGEMSLVGPRPHVAGMKAAGIDYDDLVPYYDVRAAMRPGLTGWAQANGLRGPTDDAAASKARIDHDIAYIQNFSVWLDAKIVWQTFCREVLGGSGV
jgi:polysaccharide biosynthesis protein PslA